MFIVGYGEKRPGFPFSANILRLIATFAGRSRLAGHDVKCERPFLVAAPL